MPRSSRPSRPAATAPHLHRPTVSVAYLNLLVEMLAERGIDAARLFSGIPFERDLLTRVVAAKRDPDFAGVLGRHLRQKGFLAC